MDWFLLTLCAILLICCAYLVERNLELRNHLEELQKEKYQVPNAGYPQVRWDKYPGEQVWHEWRRSSPHLPWYQTGQMATELPFTPPPEAHDQG